MNVMRAALVASAMLAVQACASAGSSRSAQAPTATEQMPVGEAAVVKVRGTIAAIDKENRTVTLQGPQGRRLTIDVRDPRRLDEVNVGDPVVIAYFEALAVQVRKAGTATSGMTVEEARVGSKPGETPGGAIGREITVTAAVTAVDRKAQTVTIRGPHGHEETIKVRDPKHLEGVEAGNLVELTYIQALAVTLDKPTN
jgi:hypothetical protein